MNNVYVCASMFTTVAIVVAIMEGTYLVGRLHQWVVRARREQHE